jgi:hypothetical protein
MSVSATDLEDYWLETGRVRFEEALLKLEPELPLSPEEMAFSPFAGPWQIVDRLRNVIHETVAFPVSRGRSTLRNGGDFYPENFSEAYEAFLEELQRTDPNGLYVAWGLSEMAEEPSAWQASAMNSLSLLVHDPSDDVLPAWYYMLMIFNQPAARYLGRIPNSDAFVEAWMEQPIPDPEFSYMALEDPNYIDFAVALDKALRPQQVVDRSVFTTTPMAEEAMYRILGDAIEEGDMQRAVKILKDMQRAALPRERKHGLEGA